MILQMNAKFLHSVVRSVFLGFWLGSIYRSGWPLFWKSGKSRKIKRVKIIRERSGNFEMLSQYKGCITSQFQLVDLRFCQNAISRSKGKLSEVREKSERSQGK